MAWTPDVIAGVTIALVLAVIGFGGSLYCAIHKKRRTQGEVSTVDKWLGAKGGNSTALGVAGGYGGFANAPGTELRDMDRHRDVERGEGTLDGVDNMGEPRAPPPVYDEGRVVRGGEREGLEGETRRNSEVPGYQERS
ncbi:uncharacterized protein AB675_1395 [Cyphellophora attinorum]|uniref:Uncharacterized protein n=1 Tax=Cyphellophora attinorum TaxID=1664694 RepID=A0A0N1NVJ1_9EURO|nr:uncharacterized protein AB675_1395 [Phialophora attinorum]KPI34436.1 hypothetical protein AB675_1395 [Phialophora attinorum]